MSDMNIIESAPFKAPANAPPTVTPSIALFVPGRVCLVGEHSDAAGGFRTRNPAIPPGHALVAATVEGLRATATARPHDRALALDSTLGGRRTIPPDALLHAATRQPHSPWRYAAGVAYLVHERFAVAGVTIVLHDDDSINDSNNNNNNNKNTRHRSLPAGKGLSSSAALCVLVARALNRLYALQLTAHGEMELAYAGERLTGALCGRMDQCVALGSAFVAQMTFDGDVSSHRILATPATATIYIVFADLAAAKDTAVILRDLQAAYPFPTTKAHETLHDALGPQNERIVRRAADALAAGDAAALGALYDEAQALFDQCAMPLCPAQLTAPRLHAALANPRVRPLVFGGKGVGSQGDGAVQFVARGHAQAAELVDVLHSLGLRDARILPIGGKPCDSILPELTALGCHADPAAAAPCKDRMHRAQSQQPNTPVLRTVKTAVIPAAGFGTRLFPASRSIRPKSLLPIVDKDGYVKPLLLHLVEQCVAAGITKVIIVSGPGDQVVRVREVFSKVDGPLASKLKPHMRDYAASISLLEDMVDIVVQETPEGFGHAIAQAAPKLGPDEPFLLLLGDVVFKVPQDGTSCVRQVLDVFERDPTSRSVIGVTEVPVDDAGAYGVVHTAEDGTAGRALRVIDFVEKPDKEAASLLAENDKCKIVLGPYVLCRTVMDALVQDVADDARLTGEIQLTPAVARIKDRDGLLAVVLGGEALDTGNPAEYSETMVKLAEYVVKK